MMVIHTPSTVFMLPVFYCTWTSIAAVMHASAAGIAKLLRGGCSIHILRLCEKKESQPLQVYGDGE